MTREPMTLEEFDDALAVAGPDTALWAEPERTAAEALLARSEEARMLLEDYRRLDAAFASARADAPPLPDALAARILADAATHSPARPGMRPARRAGVFAFLDRIAPAWRPAATCAASAALGLWLGYLAPESIAEAATAVTSIEVADASDSFIDDEGGFIGLGGME